MGARDLIRWLTPAGLLESHRRRFKMGRLKLSDDKSVEVAVEACRYELWPSFLRRGAESWSLVDVGANQGDFIRSVSELVDLKSVHAFEPLPVCHGGLEDALRKIRNHHLHPSAVGSASGELEINFTGDSKMSSVLEAKEGIETAYHAGDFDVMDKIKVPVVTLDEALPHGLEIGLLKVDVQGFEMEVFKGATNILGLTKAVLLEVNYVQHYEGGATFEEVFDSLRWHGFRIYGISAPYGSGEAGPLWADAMFVKQ